MKANETPFHRFLAQPDTQFIIPVYQRNYDWKEQHCRQLLDDIIAIGKDTSGHAHFIGSIVLIHDDVYASSGIRELTIIDGQQRITTITLIYLVIYILAQELQNESLKNRITETYLINKFAAEEEKLKLKPTENNDKALKYLLRNESTKLYPEYSKLIENYTHFKKWITTDNLDIVRKGLEKLIFVEISLERGKDVPQRIFESLNSTGLALSQADLIRNYILMELPRKDQQKLFETYWQPIEEYATDKKNCEKKVSEFIRDCLIIERREIPPNDKIYELFKKTYPNNTLEKIEPLLAKLKTFGSYYHKFLNPDTEADQDMREQFRFIHQLEISVSYPFLLEVYDDYSTQHIDKKTLIEVLETIQSFVWRRFIVGFPPNALTTVFMRLYEDVDSSNYLESIQRSLLKRTANQRFPNDAEVLNLLKEKDMYNIFAKHRRYFLECLENYQNPEKVLIENNSKITIEHIFPQHPNLKWRRELGEETCQVIKEKYVNTIANLTLSGNNGALGDKSFQEKRDMNLEGKEQGYRFSRLWLNRHLRSLEKWDLEEIEKRYDIIAERFKQIWQYPALEGELEEKSGYHEVNIFETEEPHNKKLSYVILFDQKIGITRISKLYTYVIKKLFDLQSQMLFTTDLSEKLGLSTTKEHLKQAVQLNDTYYIEVQIDDKTKFERIKYALSVFGYEEALFIKYADEPNTATNGSN